jgi:hypothetical protein
MLFQIITSEAGVISSNTHLFETGPYCCFKGANKDLLVKRKKTGKDKRESILQHLESGS